MPSPLRDLGAAVSLSNLCVASAWLILANQAQYIFYYLKHPRGYTELTSLGLDVLLLAGLFWGVIALVRLSRQRFVHTAARWIFLLILTVPINSFLHSNPYISLLSNLSQLQWVLLPLGVSVILILWALVRWQRQIARAALTGVMILAPMVPINFGYSLWLLKTHGRPAEAFNNRAPAPVTNPEAKFNARVLLIVFDEMDQHQAFERLSSDLRLPEFDRLRSEALVATRAFPPGTETLSSIPALITGRTVASTEEKAPNELLLTFDDKSTAPWSKQPNIFSWAREKGARTALVGWSHPYCRVIGDSLDSCSWEPVTVDANPVLDPFTIKSGMLLWARKALFSVPSFFRLIKESYLRSVNQDHITGYSRLMEQARKVSTDPNYNLVLIHLSVPHLPGIYNSRTNSLSSDPDNSYDDNLVLADRTLGELRRLKEAAGTWDASTVLITSDHWWRDSPTVNGRREHRVPFILKLAGQKMGVQYVTPFNTVVTRDLLIGVMTGSVKESQDVVQWLDQHSGTAENQYTRDLP